MKKIIFAVAVFAGLSAMASEQSEWSGSQVNLSVDGDSALIQEPCGQINIQSGWNTSGLKMSGESCGGPLCRVFTPVTLTANELDGKIYLQIEGDDQPLVLAPGRTENFFRCL